MSLGLTPLETISETEPIVAFPKNYTWLMHKGGPNYTFYPQTSSNYSNSQITWDVISPSLDTAMDRYVVAEVKFQIDFTGPAPATGNLLDLNSGIWGMRAFPLNKVISSISSTINGVQFAYLPSDYMDALEHIERFIDEASIYQTSFPSLSDNSQTYHSTYQHRANVLNPTMDNPYFIPSRGAFPITVISNTPTSASIQVTIREPMLIPPFVLSPEYKEVGLLYVNILKFQLQLGQLNRILSYNTVDGNVLTTVSTKIVSQPILRTLFVTPSKTMELPPIVKYPYLEINEYQTQNAANNIASQIGTDTTFAMASNSVQINYIPSEIIIFAKRQLSDVTASDGYEYADAFANMKSITVTFMNKSGLLSSASEEDLWRLSVQNGLRMSWDQWHGSGQYSSTDSGSSFNSLGSILILKPYKDLGLDPDLATGVSEVQSNLSVTAYFQNQSPETISFTLFILAFQEGVVDLRNDGTAFKNTILVSRSEVLNAPEKPISKKEVSFLWGGSFWSDFVKGFKQGFRGAAEFAPEAIRAVGNTLGEVKNVLGLGKYPQAMRSQIAHKLSNM